MEKPWLEDKITQNLHWDGYGTAHKSAGGKLSMIPGISEDFHTFGLHWKKDEYVFYVGSLTYIYNLIDKYGDEFISEIVANNCTSYEEIRSSIENLTGYNINDSIKNISVGWIKQQYILVLEELNVDY